MDNCYYGVMRMTHGLLPKMATQGASKNVDWKEFWKKFGGQVEKTFSKVFKNLQMIFKKDPQLPFLANPQLPRNLPGFPGFSKK